MRSDRIWFGIVLIGLAAGCDGPPPPIQPRITMAGHTAEITALAYAPDGRTLVSRGADSIQVWDAATLHDRASFPSDRTEFGSVAISPDGRTLAATLLGRGIVTWDLASKAERAVLRDGPASTAEPAAPEAFGWGLAYAPNGSILAGPSEDQAAAASIRLWDLARQVPTDLGPPNQPATHLAFTPDSRALVAKSMEGTIRVWDLASKTERSAISSSASYLAAISISADGKLVASAGDDRYLRIYEVDSGREVGKFKGHLKAILGIAFHPDGRHIVTGDSAGTIFLWDIPTRQVIAQFKGHQGKVWAVTFRPDGRELATAGEDRTIRVWDVGRVIDAAAR